LINEAASTIGFDHCSPSRRCSDGGQNARPARLPRLDFLGVNLLFSSMIRTLAQFLKELTESTSVQIQLESLERTEIQENLSQGEVLKESPSSR
jgi:hypothetical protein